MIREMIRVSSLHLQTLRELDFNNTILFDCHKITDYGEPLNIWRWLFNHYSEHIPMSHFQIESNFKACVEDMFRTNEFKYQKLLKTMDMYDPLNPYHITEEHTLGSKVGKQTTTPSGITKVQDKSTSMDNLTPQVTDESETSYINAKTEVTYDHDVSETFEDKTLNNLSSSQKRFDSRKGNIGNQTLSDLMNKERESALNFNLIDIICKDIIDMTCLKIYSPVNWTERID